MTTNPIHPIQAMVDGMNAEAARERAASSQWTLSEMIEALKALDPEMKVNIESLGSYRGYYSDLAFGSSGQRTRNARGLYSEIDWKTLEVIPDTKAPEDAIEEPRQIETVADLLADCESALGSCFMGYKGGDFWMTGNTVLWVSGYGTASGHRVVGLDLSDDSVSLTTELEP